MVHVALDESQTVLSLPLDFVRVPVELRLPQGFRPDDLATWPDAVGRLEFVGGRLLYMPPCGEVQQRVSVDVSTLLVLWARSQSGFVVGGNEAGMLLGGDVRAADVAVWRQSDAQPPTKQVARVPPVLAVEIAGRDEDEHSLRDKSRWYLDKGVETVWLVLPDTREVIVVTANGEARFESGERLPPSASLPGLEPEVREFFLQLQPGP